MLYKKLKMYLTFFVLLNFLTYTIWQRLTYEKKIKYVVRELFVFLYLIILIKQGLHLYWIVDVLFITRPFIFLFLSMFIGFCIIWILYLFYFIINKYTKTFGLIIRLCALKSFLFFICTLPTIKLIITIIHFENMNSQNFFQELIIKMLLFNCSII